MLLFGLEIPLWLVLMAMLCILFYWHGTSTYKTFEQIGIPYQRPSSIPYLGNIPEILSTSIPDETVKIRTLFPGKIFGSFLGEVPIVNVGDIELLREITIRQFSKFRNHLSLIDGEDNVHTRHMGVITDDHWKHVRTTISPTFTLGKLKQMFPVIKDCADKLIMHLKLRSSEPTAIKDFTSGYTMDVIASTAFGLDIDTQKTTQHPFVVNASILMGVQKDPPLRAKVKGFIMMLVLLLFPKFIRVGLSRYLGISLIDLDCAKYFDEVVNRVLEDREKTGDVRQKDFISMCSKAIVDIDTVSADEVRVTKGIKWTTAGLTMQDFVANASIFLIAGYETTATALEFFLYSMAVHPDIQEKLHSELTQGVDLDDLTYEQVQKCEYLDWCIQESLRIFPPVQKIDRICNEDFSIDNIVIPKGTRINGLVYAIHHDADYWPEPEKFNPERFSPANKTDMQQYAWLPFGAGNRNCVASRLAMLEIRVALIKLIQTFRFESTAETPAMNQLKFKAFSGFLQTATPLKISAVLR